MSIQQETQPTPTTEKTVHEMDPRQAEETQRGYVCAGCYGQVIARYNHKTRTSTVACDTPDCTCPGFVTRSWAERQQRKSHEELVEARETLRDAAPWINPHKGKSPDQLLKELGF